MIINRFKDWLTDNRGFSIDTVKNYERTIKLFDRYLKKVSLGKRGVGQCEKITLSDINFFIQHNKNLGKDTKTCNNYTACIKNFLRFCLIMGYDVEDYRKILYAREKRKKIDCLEDEECTQLMNHFRRIRCRNKREEIIKMRNLCIVQILMYTGLRVSELANLKIEDIGRELQIIGKGGKRRVVYLYPEDLKLLDSYLFMRKNYKSEWLFISFSSNSTGHHLSRVSIETIIRDGAKDAGIKKKVFPHKLRHTFATNLMRAKVELPYISGLLGHENIATTQTYLSVLNTDLEKAQKHVKRY